MKAVTEQSGIGRGRIARGVTVARTVRFAAGVADGRGGIRGDVRGVRSRVQLRRVLQADGGGVRCAAQRDLGGVLDHGAGVVFPRPRHGTSVGSLRPANRGRHRCCRYGRWSRADLDDRSTVARLPHLRTRRRRGRRMRIRADGRRRRRMVPPTAQHGAGNCGGGNRIRHGVRCADCGRVDLAHRMARNVSRIRRSRHT